MLTYEQVTIGYFKSIGVISLPAISKYKCEEYHPYNKTKGSLPLLGCDCAPSSCNKESTGASGYGP